MRDHPPYNTLVSGARDSHKQETSVAQTMQSAYTVLVPEIHKFYVFLLVLILKCLLCFNATELRTLELKVTSAAKGTGTMISAGKDSELKYWDITK